MATVSARSAQEAELDGAPLRATTLNWGNSAPLALLAFAVTTFMLSMVNANAISAGVQPVVAILVLTFFFLGAGFSGANTTMIHWGGYFRLAGAVCAFYLALVELCEFSYGRMCSRSGRWPGAERPRLPECCTQIRGGSNGKSGHRACPAGVLAVAGAHRR
jgi:succinate-acetate transporter protein